MVVIAPRSRNKRKQKSLAETTLSALFLPMTSPLAICSPPSLYCCSPAQHPKKLKWGTRVLQSNRKPSVQFCISPNWATDWISNNVQINRLRQSWHWLCSCRAENRCHADVTRPPASARRAQSSDADSKSSESKRWRLLLSGVSTISFISAHETAEPHLSQIQSSTSGIQWASTCRLRSVHDVKYQRKKKKLWKRLNWHEKEVKISVITVVKFQSFTVVKPTKSTYAKYTWLKQTKINI